MSAAPSGAGAGGGRDGTERERRTAVLIEALLGLGLEPVAVGGSRWMVMLAGERKRTIPVLLHLDERSLKLTSLFSGAPDEAATDVHRLLLHANERPTPVHFALDDAGDVVLVGRLPIALVDADAVDELLGLVLAMSDEHFDRVLATGFAGYLAAEQRWRARVGLPPNPVGAP